MRATQEHLQFEGVQLLEETSDIPIELLLDLGLAIGRLGLAEFNHYLEIFELFLSGQKRLDFIAERAGFFDDLLRLFAIIPKILGCHQSVELAQALLCAGHVKETSASGPACPARSSIRL